MTIIAYSKGWLGADSRAVHDSDEMGEQAILSATQLIKLRVFGQQRIAVAVSGPVPTEVEWEQIETMLLRYCIYLELLHPEQHRVIFAEEHKEAANVFNNRFLFIMTKQRTYVLARDTPSAKGPANGLIEVESSLSLCYGSGMAIANVAFTAGMGLREALEFTLEQDYLTGGPVLCVSRDELEPFRLLADVFKEIKGMAKESKGKKKSSRKDSQ